MDLIDRDELRMLVCATYRCNGKTAFAEAISTIINSAPTVDAIPVEWIEKHISEIGDNSTIAEAYNLLIEIWKAEQEE